MTTYSHSRLMTFEECPYRYFCRYVEKIVSPFEYVEAFMGSRVHEAFEYLYTLVRVGRVPSLDDVLTFYRTAWHNHRTKKLVVVHSLYSEEDYFRIGETCIRNYYTSYAPFDHALVIGIEKSVSMPLNDQHDFIGIIDRLDYNPRENCYEIHDYKTSLTLPSKKELESSLQLPLYQLAVQTLWDDVSRVRLIWHYVYFNKEIAIEKRHEDIAHLKSEVLRRISVIEAAEKSQTFPPKTSTLCEWCEYRQRCPAWKHRSQIESLPPEAIDKDEGVRLVEAYASLQAQLDELLARREALRNRIATYAAEHNLTTLYAGDKKLLVRTYPRYDIPDDDRVRYTLQSILQKYHLWDKYSTVNIRALQSALANGELPETVTKELLPLVQKGTTTWVKLVASDGE